MDELMERAQLLARFKLSVKRTLNESVDLDLLTRDALYARKRLAEIEEAATEESLLIMVLRLREMLLPSQPLVAPPSPSVITPEAKHKETRDYKMGARSW